LKVNDEEDITVEEQEFNEDVVMEGLGTFTYLAVNPGGEGDLTVEIVY